MYLPNREHTNAITGESVRADRREIVNGAKERLAVSVREAAQLAGIGLTCLYAAIDEGKVKARKLGRRTLILRRDLEMFLDGLPAKTEASEAHRSYVRRRWDAAKGAVPENVSR